MEPVTSEAMATRAPEPGAGPETNARPAWAPTPEPAELAAPIQAARPGLNLEQFMGVKLFAWVGGFALFLAVAFFVKYSFDQGWISPTTRVICGFLAGLGLVTGGVLLKRREYAVTAHALCGTGVVILYAASFAAHRPYALIGNGAAFALMTLITVTAFLLAVRLPALVVAVLGMLGGFLTPPLLSTGVDNPVGLFGYIAILDAGLIAVALKRRWHFLVALGALGTLVIQIGWVASFFAPEKVYTALAVFAGFNVLFLAPAVLVRRDHDPLPWTTAPALGLAGFTIAFTLWLLTEPEIRDRPGVLYSFLLAAELPVAALTLRQPRWVLAQPIAGAGVFLVLAVWTSNALTPALLYWALAGYLGFAALHTLFPILQNRCHHGSVPVWVGHLFPPVALLLVMLPMLREITVPWATWIVVLLVDALAIGLALLTGAVVGVLAMVALTVATTAVWLVNRPPDPALLPELLLVAGGFAVFFFLVGLRWGERLLGRLEASAGRADAAMAGANWLDFQGGRPAALAQIPALSALMPFLLLIMAVERLPLVNPSALFGLALVLGVLLLVLAWRLELDVLAPVALGCTVALEFVWHARRFTPEYAGVTVAWYAAFTLLYLGFPFVARQRFAERIAPWAAAALAGPLHFFMVYNAVKQAWPNEVMGLLPAAFAATVALALAGVARWGLPTPAQRLRLLAWFGGSTLFFVTLIFPIQFEKQWLTVAWALEGTALLWLFRRLPHPGLRAVGAALLVVAFARLALNPLVFEYHPRGDTRILNWFLYSYGIVTACLLAGARLLPSGQNRIQNVSLPALFNALAGILGFLLLNIEIADWFSTGTSLAFDFNASFGQDMTYSIAWGLYAFLVLGLGFRSGSKGARYAGLGLFLVTIVKLFLHDLWRLGGLYRIGSLIGLAVVLMVVSFLYQKYLAARPAGAAESNTAE